MEQLFQLEVMGLVSNLMSELENHLGVADKNLAEFTIAQRLECGTFEEFERKITKFGGDSFSPSLLESIDRLVRTTHPAMKAKTAAKHGESNEQRSNCVPPLERPTDLQSETYRNKRHRSPHSQDRRPPDRYERRRHHDQRWDEDAKEDARGSHRERRDRRLLIRDEEAEGDTSRPYRDGRNRKLLDRDEDDTPVLYQVYDGVVTGTKDFGAFVSLRGVRGRAEGLVHISQLSEWRSDVSDLPQRGQSVKVKVVTIDRSRIGLSMKGIDQETGQDADSQPKLGSGANSLALGQANVKSHEGSSTKRRKRMTSPERWEIRQLIASGVAKASDYPDLNVDYSEAHGETALEEDLDIEVRDEEPPFLTGQTKQSLELSPIRVIKAPEGSMNRAATSGAALGRERAELRQYEAKGEMDKQADPFQEKDSMLSRDKTTVATDLWSARLNTANLDTLAERDPAYAKEFTRATMKNMTIKEQRESLPVFNFRSQLIDAVRHNEILIVVGETGSGKTTQLTQYLAEAGLTQTGMIGCTQPRRVAAMSVAKRVAEEVGCVLGEEVGYSVRFDDCTSPTTQIKYMTDGLLQREILLDPELRRYSVIMIDEAHERTIATDILFALLKKTLKTRPDLKVIVTSATLNAEKFSSYFNDAPIFTIPGRTFPVEILYSREPESDYVDAALATVMQIHLTEPVGDILLFLTGKEEIDTSCEILQERMKALGQDVPELVILPAYAALPTDIQSRIFEPAPSGSRKVVVATNIAETSITIDGIYYVVDAGFAKQNAYDPKLGMDSLIVAPISQAQANQRAGRAGRTGPGKCFRLYTEAAYLSEMLPSTIPAIQCQNLTTTILILKAMGIHDLLHFDFMDPPPVNTMLTALEELYALSILDDEGLLTRLGRKMADFPIDPGLAKVLIVAGELGCSDEILSIVAMLSLENVFYRPKEKQAQADQKKAKFHDPHGDHLTLLNVYNAWQQNGRSAPWCFENFIQARSMRRAKDVRDQLAGVMQRYRQPIISCGTHNTDQVRRALCAGFFRNAARRDPEAGASGFKTVVEGTPIFLHPSSALFGKQAEWVVYHELVLTTREYMRWTTSIDPRWLVEAAPTFFRVTGTGGNMSKRRKQERIQPLHNKFAGEDDWRLSAQRKGGRTGGGGTWG